MNFKGMGTWQQIYHKFVSFFKNNIKFAPLFLDGEKIISKILMAHTMSPP